MKNRFFLTLVLVTAGMMRAFAEPAPIVLPFEPAQILNVLPSAPAGWKVLRSEANTSLGEWVETRAIRGFQAPPAPAPESGVDAGAGAAALPPGEIEITVVDTAGFVPALAAFEGFTAGKNGNVEKKLIGALPAIVITGEAGRQFVQVLVASRYLVELTLTNLPRHRPEDWLRAFHFDALPAANKTLANRPREFRLSHIDELHPKKNRSYAVSTTNAQRVDAFLKSLPPEPAEAVANAPR